MVRPANSMRSVGRFQLHGHPAMAPVFECLEPLDQPWKFGLDRLPYDAEIAANLRRERQMERVANAKARSVYKGRKASINIETVCRLLAGGVRRSAVARHSSISRTSVWQVCRPAASNGKGKAFAST